ncbi:MAG: acyltransferase family protein [Paludibacter sp.]|nr:acyltransferase family protein [Paludibacter sp.]
MASNSTNIQWLDTLRALAMLGVIFIHISSPLVNMTYWENMPFWWIGNVVDSGVRFAVPLFLMLSGATLLNKDYKPGEFYKKRFTRVLIPFMFWIVVYWIYRWVTLTPKMQPHDIYTGLKWAGNLFLKEGVSKHFWYIYMILVIYLFVPFLGTGLRKLNMSAVFVILLFWITLAFMCKSIPMNMYNWSGNYGSKLFGYFIYSGYLVLGYYLVKLPAYSSKIRFLAAAIFILSIIVSAVSTYFFSLNAHKLNLSIYGYLSINTIIQSIALFMWIKDSSFNNNYLAWIIKTISNYSYGIYLVHIIIISILFDNGIYWKTANPLVSLPLIVLMVFVCSFGIIFVLRKMPGGKYIAG